MSDDIKKFYAKIGAEGGEANTPAKVKAARANGQLGGRPRKATPSAATLAKRKYRARLKREQQNKKRVK